MQLSWNNFALDTLGKVSLVEETVNYEPPEAPQKRIVNLTFRIDVWLKSYNDNRTQMELVLQKLAKQDGDAVLLVRQEAIPGYPESTSKVLYNQPATLVSHNFPADVNEWGTMRQQIRISFQLECFDLTTNLLAAKVTTYGTPPETYSLGVIKTWKESKRIGRYDELHDTRERSTGTVAVTGEIFSDDSSPTKTIAQRRIDLALARDALMRVMDNKKVHLHYGPSTDDDEGFNRDVRVTDLDIDFDQARTCLKYSFTATYTAFPNEADYAVCEFEVNTRDDTESTESILTVSGRILAVDQSTAEILLETITAAAIAGRTNFSAAKMTRNELRTKHISNADQDIPYTTRDTFVEMSFNQEYRAKKAGYFSWTLSVDDRLDNSNGLLTRTYSGAVVYGPDPTDTIAEYDYGFRQAALKARELGDGKHTIQLSSSIKDDSRLTHGTSTSAGTKESIRVEFAFVYLLRSERLYAEVRSTTNVNTFGEDTETVAGFVVGDTAQAALDYLDTIKALYAGRVIRNLETTETEIHLAAGAYAGLPTTGITVEQLWDFIPTGATSTLVTKLDFQFSLFKDNANKNALKYSMAIGLDWPKLTRTVTVQGSFFSSSAIMGSPSSVDLLPDHDGTGIREFFEAMNLGTLQAEEYNIDYEYSEGETASPGYAVKTDFRLTYLGRITGQDLVLECEVQERIKFSGNRNVEIGVPDQESEIQHMGTTVARRTISGSVTAATETAALNWVKEMKALPYMAANTQTGYPAAPDSDDIHPEGPELAIAYRFLPMVTGNPRAADPEVVNFHVCVVTFSFDFLIPSYLYTT